MIVFPDEAYIVRMPCLGTPVECPRMDLEGFVDRLSKHMPTGQRRAVVVQAVSRHFKHTRFQRKVTARRGS